jgi:hypothetical protein
VKRFAILGEVWAYLIHRKKWWLLPIVVALVLMGGLLIATEGSAIMPFIYALF